MEAPEPPQSPEAAAALAHAAPPSTLSGRIQTFRDRHARLEIALVLVAGFAFDVFTLARIDNFSNLLQQGGYLLALGLLLAFEQYTRLVRPEAPRGLGWLWRFHELGTHFFLGSLLSAFALYFFKSASSISAFFFLAIMFGLLVANELPRFQKQGPVVRFALYALCLTAYFSYLLPVLAGVLAGWLFVLSVVVASLPVAGLYLLALRWGGDRKTVLKQVAGPAATMQAVLLALYFAGAIPPLPLSLQYIGVFHDVKKDEAGYQLFHERAAWRFWERGDQQFRYRPGDKVFVFASVFAPMSVQKGNLPLHFHWFYDHPGKGWQPSGQWTYTGLQGGRAEGFRIFATRSEPRPGKWRVEIRAPDGREVGSIRFRVIPDDGTEERLFQVQPG